MKCKKTVLGQKVTYTALWKVFYPDCRKRLLFCNAGAGAYVPAATVCLQSL
jgi:hypothetical protein